MNEQPTKENTLYLPIKQVFFDQIIAGTKKEEYREFKDTTASRYVLKDDEGYVLLDPETTEEDREYFVDDYNDGKFPFLLRDFKYLHLAVGYAKERDTALVECTGYRMIPTDICDDEYATWIIAYQIGRIIEVHRKSKE